MECQNCIPKSTCYGPLLKTVHVTTLEGKEVPVTIVNVFSLLLGIVSAGGAFADLMLSSLATDGCLKTAFYTDKVTPGNVLATSPSRKIWTMYMSFTNFPAQILSNQDAWITICIQRTSFVNTLAANMSRVFKKSPPRNI